MSRFLKALFAAVSALGLVFSGMTAANATTGLTLAEFQALPLYQEILANTATTTTAISSAWTIKQNTHISVQSFGIEAASADATVQAIHGASQGNVSITLFGSAPETVDFGYISGQYYSPMPEAVDLPEVKNLSAVLTRLKKRDAEYLISQESYAPTEAGELDPTKLFSAATADPMQGIDAVLTNASYSDLTKVNSIQDLTSYLFTVTIPAAGATPAMAFDVQLDYTTATGVIKNQIVTSSISGLIVVQTNSIEIGGAVSVRTAMPAYSVKLSDLVTMDNRIKAEATLATKVKALSAKAVALAKKAKKTLNGTHITAAAKALKYVVTAIKNGVKLSAKVSGVTGSICVAAAGGKVVTTTC